jgi:hypothetical protein
VNYSNSRFRSLFQILFSPYTTFFLNHSLPEFFRLFRHIIRHHFCPTCGCATHNEGVTPDGRSIIAINSRCIRDIDPAQLTIKPFDGRSL